MMKRIGLRVILVVAIVSTIARDRATKHIATTMLAGTANRSFLADPSDLNMRRTRAPF
jgi:hypothetical protein